MFIQTIMFKEFQYLGGSLPDLIKRVHFWLYYCILPLLDRILL